MGVKNESFLVLEESMVVVLREAVNKMLAPALKKIVGFVDDGDFNKAHTPGSSEYMRTSFCRASRVVRSTYCLGV